MLSVLGIEENKEVDQGRLDIQPQRMSKSGKGRLSLSRESIAVKLTPSPTFINAALSDARKVELAF